MWGNRASRLDLETFRPRRAMLKVLFLNFFLEICQFKWKEKNKTKPSLLALCFTVDRFGWALLRRERLRSTLWVVGEVRWPYLFVTEAGHLVHKFLLDHESGQVGCVAGQEDDGEEGPHGHHDLAGGSFGVLDRHGVVEHQAPEEPYSFSNCKRRSMGCCK